MTCPYKTLGIKNDSTQETVRKAYLNMAMKWHPDKNPDNQEEATRRFREINDAYETISNRKIQTFDLDSIIDSFFGYVNRKFGKENNSRNILIDVNVTLENLFCGTECLINYERQIIDESKNNDFCSNCNGYGYKTVSQKTGTSSFVNRNEDCENCFGTGFSGSLRLSKHEMNIKVPPKTPNDDKLVFKGYGHQSLDGSWGDLIVQLVNYKHPIYERDGNDLIADIDISFKEALLGFERVITNLDTTTFKLRAKGPIRIGRKISIKGRGMTQEGLMILNINFEMPRRLSDEQIKIIEENF